MQFTMSAVSKSRFKHGSDLEDEKVDSSTRSTPTGSRSNSRSSSPAVARRSKLATKHAKADDIELVNSVVSSAGSESSTASAAAPTSPAGAGGAVEQLTYEELEKKIAETESLNDAVALQIDSVLQNLEKKGVTSLDKQRMRVIMAALTAENMHLDLLVRDFVFFLLIVL